MKIYKFELIINEQSDEFYEEITNNGKSGCDEVFGLIKEELDIMGLDFELRLIGFEEK